MADTKITGLAANTTPVSTDVTVIIDDPGGTPVSQKITLANLMALFANPVSDNGDALGTGALKWADLFLASGGVISWNNGDVTLTHGTNTLTFAGGSLSVTVDGAFVVAASTGTAAPVTITPGTLVTTPADGSVEIDATNFYGTTDAGNRGYIPLRHFARTAAGRTLTNTTNEQAIFDPGLDTLTLEAGVYRFESILRFTAMSGTSGNARIDWPGAGTATIDTWMWWYSAVDNTNIGPGPLTPQVGWPAQADSAASIATAGTGTALGVTAWGTFDVTTGGTFIPTIDLVTGAAANVNPGSYFMCERMGASDVENVGQWT